MADDSRAVWADAGDGKKTICLLPETGQGGWQYSLPMLDGVARDGGSVLITGETGTGKELLARYLHDRSCCADRPYVTINCTGLSEQLMRGELFGWKRGSFTGANEDYDGLIRQAQGGTVFLDEIGNMDPQNQGRLLRFLQTGEIQPLGEPTQRVQARVIAATNKPVGPGDGAPCMIEDLFYRFRFSDMRIPALRDRGDDVFRLLLSPGFLDQTKFTGITAQTLCRLADDPWCGNIRDLHRYCRNRSLGAGGRPPETDKPPHILDDQMPKGDRDAWYGFAVFCLHLLEHQWVEDMASIRADPHIANTARLLLSLAEYEEPPEARTDPVATDTLAEMLSPSGRSAYGVYDFRFLNELLREEDVRFENRRARTVGDVALPTALLLIRDYVKVFAGLKPTAGYPEGPVSEEFEESVNGMVDLPPMAPPHPPPEPVVIDRHKVRRHDLAVVQMVVGLSRQGKSARQIAADLGGGLTVPKVNGIIRTHSEHTSDRPRHHGGRPRTRPTS